MKDCKGELKPLEYSQFVYRPNPLASRLNPLRQFFSPNISVHGRSHSGKRFRLRKKRIEIGYMMSGNYFIGCGDPWIAHSVMI